MAVPAPVKRWDVVVVGEIYADHIFSGFEAWPRPGEEVLAEHYLRELGGGSVNTACGLARLGRRTRLFGVVGEGDRGWFERRLGEFGVDTGSLHAVPGDTGVTVSVSTREDRSFFTYLGANRELGALLAREQTLAELSDARHVHFAMPLERAQAAALLPALRLAGCTTSLDVGHNPGWLADPANRASCREVDFFLPNQREAELVSGAAGPESYAAWARSAGLRRAVLKLGAAGAMAVEGGATCWAAPPRVDALDSTGAGDAFDAGWLDAWLDGAPPEQRLRRACICGALCAGAAGALAGLPDTDLLWSTYEHNYGP